jgi:hypothetical protein
MPIKLGSATGSEGFHGRWSEHLSVGGDALGFKSREASDYQVLILEVSGSGASDGDILDAEQLWIKKLRSAVMGLNRTPNFAGPPGGRCSG